MNIDRTQYLEECSKRWSGICLSNARRNWSVFEEHKAFLIEWMTRFHRDPFFTDITGHCHNSEGTLTALCWKMQTAIEPDRSCLHPFLDFEEYHQKVFCAGA